MSCVCGDDRKVHNKIDETWFPCSKIGCECLHFMPFIPIPVPMNRRLRLLIIYSLRFLPQRLRDMITEWLYPNDAIIVFRGD